MLRLPRTYWRGGAAASSCRCAGVHRAVGRTAAAAFCASPCGAL